MRRNLKHQLWRGWNVVRRVAVGLPPTGVVSPEVRNDLFQALFSLYCFCERFAPARRVLDLGCGVGYGMAHLLAHQARGGLGIDADPRLIRYARRRFAAPGLDFLACPLDEPPPGDRFDLVVGTNLLVHAASYEKVLAVVTAHLNPEGTFLTTMPPIANPESMQAARATLGLRTYLYLWYWEAILGEHFASVRAFRHQPPAGAVLDPAAPFPSLHRARDFRFEESHLEDFRRDGGLSAVFVCEGLRR